MKTPKTIRPKVTLVRQVLVARVVDVARQRAHHQPSRERDDRERREVAQPEAGRRRLSAE